MIISIAETWKLERNIKFGGLIKNRDKNNEKNKKKCSYKESLKKLGSTILQIRRIRGDLIKTFKIMEFLLIVDIFPYFSLQKEIYCRDKLKKLSQIINCFLLHFFAIIK